MAKSNCQHQSDRRPVFIIKATFIAYLLANLHNQCGNEISVRVDTDGDYYMC